MCLKYCTKFGKPLTFLTALWDFLPAIRPRWPNRDAWAWHRKIFFINQFLMYIKGVVVAMTIAKNAHFPQCCQRFCSSRWIVTSVRNCKARDIWSPFAMLDANDLLFPPVFGFWKMIIASRFRWNSVIIHWSWDHLDAKILIEFANAKKLCCHHGATINLLRLNEYATSS